MVRLKPAVAVIDGLEERYATKLFILEQLRTAVSTVVFKHVSTPDTGTTQFIRIVPLQSVQQIHDARFQKRKDTSTSLDHDVPTGIESHHRDTGIVTCTPMSTDGQGTITQSTTDECVFQSGGCHALRASACAADMATTCDTKRFRASINLGTLHVTHLAY